VTRPRLKDGLTIAPSWRRWDEHARDAGYDSWEAWVRAESDQKGEIVCGARTKRGVPCRTRPMANGRCRMHGGKAPRGPDAPRYRHGRYSRYLTGTLKVRYDEMGWQDLASLADDIRLAAAIVTQLAEGLDVGATMEGWRAVGALGGEVIAAIEHDQIPRAKAAAQEIQRVVRDARQQFLRLEELRRQQDHLRRLFGTQTERDRVAGEYLHRSVVLAVLSAAGERAARVVRDPAERIALASAMRGLVEQLGVSDVPRAFAVQDASDVVVDDDGDR